MQGFIIGSQYHLAEMYGDPISSLVWKFPIPCVLCKIC